MNNWYESSIKSLVEEFFKNNGFEIIFDPSKFWDENMKDWLKCTPASEHEKFTQTAKEARSYAFNQKYGTYSYITDYCSVCKNWNYIIIDEIKKIVGDDLSNKKLLAVGANNGSELAIIFGNEFQKMEIDVVEISETACLNGKKLFPHIDFHCSSMDEITLPESKYDIFISLRAAYCAGNNLNFIVKKAIHSVKPGGIIMFSISNGYIDIKNGNYTPIKGVYNPETNRCDEFETARNINWMKDAMLSNGCSNVTLIDAESEILIISKI